MKSPGGGATPPCRSTFVNLDREKQDRILRVAVEEFGDKGYARASINAIVRKLGIAKGSIFQYFGDKEGLFRFVFDAATEMVKDYLRTVRDQTADADLFTRLEATLLAGNLFLRKHPVVYRLYLRTLLETQLPCREAALSALRSYSLKYLRSLLDDAAGRGELREGLDIDAAAFLLDAAMDRFLQTRAVPHLDAGLGLYDCSEETARRWIRQLVDALRLGIGHP
jgi:TetR/AcrR family transcriptional regulator